MAVAQPVLTDGGRPKLSWVLARNIENEILASRPPVGTVLGSESELLARYGVSRAVFREAIRSVEHTGLAAMRRGPGGGLLAAQPDQRAVADALTIWFSYTGVTVAELHETRLPLELCAVRLAAERVDEAGIERLRGALADLDARARHDEGSFSNFERLLFELSGNPVLSLFAGALLGISLSRVRGTGARLEPPITAEDAARHLRGYHHLADAIIRGDSAEAQTRMTALLRALEGRLRDRPVRTRRRPTPVPGTGGKLPGRVASAIRDDIERAGWQVGSVLGSESELIERYGVSRSTLREAIRMLERHNAVRTKRGPGGGLVVAEPDGVGVVRAAEISLEYESTTSLDLLEVRSALEMTSVRLAAERCTDAAAEKLRATIAAEANAPLTSGQYHELHRRLAAMTGNRPLELFIRILSHLTGLHVPSNVSRRVRVAELRSAHAGIVDAVVRGDSALAEHRMARHMEAAGTVVE